MELWPFPCFLITAYPQCGTPFYSLPSTPYDPARIGVQGEFGGIGHIPARQNLWNVQSQIDTLNQTYEIASSIEIWNYRATRLVEDLRDQAQLFSCSGGVYTVSTTFLTWKIERSFWPPWLIPLHIANHWRRGRNQWITHCKQSSANCIMSSVISRNRHWNFDFNPV
jgi:hypothetical protein